jgi:hypothetical protein
MNCKFHPGLPATGRCGECGGWLCAGCTIDAAGATYCRPCRATRVFPVGPRPRLKRKTPEARHGGSSAGAPLDEEGILGRIARRIALFLTFGRRGGG